MELLPIGVVAARSGMAPSALRYYEDQGLLPAATRTPGGARRYPRTVLRRLAVIRAARNVGLSLPEIRTALAGLPEDRPPSAEDWARLSRDWRDRIDEQISALTELRDGLTSCIGCGCLSLARCSLFNPGDVAAAEGSGARRLPPALRRSSPSG
jgi:MerR family redox-sensitive transcriptional activator SoxR